jgi:hypothetical protein
VSLELVSLQFAEPRPRARALATGVVLALLAAPAVAASGPAPSRMVLRASDLPPGFLVVRSETGPDTNSDVVRDLGPAIQPKLRRWGRVTGYRAVYKQRDIEKFFFTAGRSSATTGAWPSPASSCGLGVHDGDHGPRVAP